MFINNLRGLLERASRDGAGVEIIGSHLMIQCGLRSPSRAALEVRMRSARCLGVYDSGDTNRDTAAGAWEPLPVSRRSSGKPPRLSRRTRDRNGHRRGYLRGTGDTASGTSR